SRGGDRRLRRPSRHGVDGAGRSPRPGGADLRRPRRPRPRRGDGRPARRRGHCRPAACGRGRRPAHPRGRGAMNLALKDIRHGLFRFLLTCFGLGLLMTVVLAMIGIYNGLVADALAVVKAPAADVWVVEAGTKGPFAEASSIPADTRDAVARMPGVAEAGAVNYQNVEAPHAGHTLRLYVVGYEPGRPGGPLAIMQGRGIGASHFELVADRKTGLLPGDTISLGRNRFTVVG